MFLTITLDFFMLTIYSAESDKLHHGHAREKLTARNSDRLRSTTENDEQQGKNASS
jgi:hypothetical protein